MQCCTRCGKEGPDEQAVCLRCGGNMGPLGGPIYTNVHRQTGVTIVDFERYNMGYKDNFINTYLIQWTVISGSFFAGKLFGVLCLSISTFYGLLCTWYVLLSVGPMQMIQTIYCLGFFLVFYNACFLQSFQLLILRFVVFTM